jgi:hypothetical protein
MRVLMFALSFTVISASYAAQPDMVPGLWEIKTTRMQVNGQAMPDMAQMQAMMDSMPPEARAMMNAQMAGQGVQFGPGGALRSCVTAEEIKENRVYSGKKEDGCTYSNVVTTPKKVSGKVVCEAQRMRGDFEASIQSSKAYTMKMQGQSPEGKMEMEMQGHWVAASCGNLKRPAGQ